MNNSMSIDFQKSMKESRRPRVVYFVPVLAGGGAEKAVVSLLQAHDAEQFELHLLVNRLEGPWVRYIPAHVQVTEIGKKRLEYALPALMSCLRAIAPDVVVSHLWKTNVFTLLAKYGLRMKFATVMCEHSAISRERRLKVVIKMLQRWAYHNADVVVGCSQRVGEEIVELLRVPANQVKVIPNAVIDHSFYERVQEPIAHPWLQVQAEGNHIPVVIGVGRLAPEKRFDLLLQAIASMSPSRKIRAIILGEGPLRERLVSIRSKLGLDDVVDFLGYITNPLPYIAQADLFIQASDVEGLPTVLIEAVACNTPIIATQTATGTAEILQGVDDAMMVPCNDVGALAQALELQLKRQSNSVKASRDSLACPEALIRRFTSHQVIEQYSQLIKNVLAR